MKKTILFLAMITATVMFSQISDVSNQIIKCQSVGKVGPMGMFVAEVEKCGEDGYKFSYRDYKFTKITEIKSFSFVDKDGAYDFLYNTLIKGFENPPKDDITLKLPDDLLSIKFQKSLGISVVTIYHTNQVGTTGVTQSFTKKQIQKLFGKKE